MVVAAAGVVRLPDLFTRMNALARAGSTGAGLVMVAVICFHPAVAVVTRALAILFFLAFKASISGGMIDRAARITGVGLWKGAFTEQVREFRGGRGRGARVSS
jgi:multicomponent Na+:H+ antiporter subunit G